MNRTKTDKSTSSQRCCFCTFFHNWLSIDWLFLKNKTKDTIPDLNHFKHNVNSELLFLLTAGFWWFCYGLGCISCHWIYTCVLGVQCIFTIDCMHCRLPPQIPVDICAVIHYCEALSFTLINYRRSTCEPGTDPVKLLHSVCIPLIEALQVFVVKLMIVRKHCVLYVGKWGR